MFVKAEGSDGIPVATIDVEPVLIDEDRVPQSYGAVVATSAEATPLVMADSKDELDEPKFQDLPFAILFLIHLAIMIWLAVDYGTFTVDEMDYNVSNWRNYVDDDESAPTDEDWDKFITFVHQAQEWAGVYPYRILSYVILPSAMIAYTVSYLLTAYVIPSCPYFMVVSSLAGTFVWSIVIAIAMCVASNFNLFVLVTAGVILGATVYYLRQVWHMIPFAATNLMVALKGISANCGMYIVAFVFSIAGFVWTILWLYIFVGVMQAMDQAYQQANPKPEGMSKKDYEAQEQGDPMRGFVVFSLLLSLYWTSKILLNTVQVTVAGVIATWCYVEQEAQSCCSPGVFGSVYRSLTYSFGSICMGSLLQALISAIRTMIDHARNNERSGDRNNGAEALIFCILLCLIKCLEDILEYFNQWAYVYVGIYGCSYLESGRKVVELFKARGFTAFVTNDLVGYVLGFTNFSVGILTGAIAILIQTQVDKHHDSGTNSFIYGEVESSYWISMIAGFIVGIAVSSVMMNVVRGAVNTLIVCYADDPAKLEDNHPTLTQQMANSWNAAFPEAGGLAGPQYSVVV